MRFQDLTNHVFHRLTVIRRGPNSQNLTRWYCRCACGKEVLCTAGALKDGRQKSCGCLRTERATANAISRTTHGDRTGFLTTPEYKAWRGVKERCFNPKHAKYEDYGGRGITVCDRWKYSFENFLADMGRRPGPGYSIDRKKNNGRYELANCRWATTREQQNNKRSNHNVTYQGETHTIREWARLKNINHVTLRWRLARGWSLDRIFSG